MAINMSYTQEIKTVSVKEHELSLLERYVLRRFHPKSIFIDTIGIIWFTYYFWLHEWKTAVAALILGRVFAILASFNTDIDLFSETLLGRIAILHLHPANLVLQTIGVIMLLSGLWQHATTMILIGLSTVLIGHIFGWPDVDERLGNS